MVTWLLHPNALSYQLTRWIFLHGLAVIYAVAFWSLGRQVTGLIGTQGILPVGAWLDSMRHLPLGQRLWALPTVFWRSSSDRVLKGACTAGLVLSLIALSGIVVWPVLLLSWALYLSLVVAGQDFLGFQWDSLLLEIGFLALWLAPLQSWPFSSSATPLPWLPLFLLQWALFRLMFESGVVKLSCGDSTWRELRALDYHYFTQPLPTPVAWYLHHSKPWFRSASVAAVYIVEIALPFLQFAPPPGCYVTAVGTILLMVLIALSGNYTFFNWLTALLALLIFDDTVWRPIAPHDLARWASSSVGAIPVWEWGLHAALTVVILLITIPQLVRSVRPKFRGPLWSRRLERALSPFRAVNPFGLFRVMTRERPEIEIEASLDGKTWLPYAFKYKAGDVRRRPPWVAPHQPRLDWQMWFAALGAFDHEPWFQNLMLRLLQAEPEVLRLLESAPFKERPKYLRASYYLYEFTSPKERRETGAWWKRTRKGLYAPVLSLS